MQKALSIVLNSFTHDSRVQRQLSTLANSGYETHILAIHDAGLPVTERTPEYQLRRVKLRSRFCGTGGIAKLLLYAECAGRMIAAGIRLRPQLIHANDLSALPIADIVARATGATLIYDSHELWSDPGYASYQRFPRWMFHAAVLMEKYLARRAAAVITVSDGIANRMAATMSIHAPVVVRNLPNRLERGRNTEQHHLHSALNLDAAVPIILHLGVLCEDRGIEILISALKAVCEPAVVVLLGSGESDPYVETLKDQARRMGVEKRIYFMPPVAANEVCSFVSDADVGVSLLRNNCLNNQLALPNKLFEYLQAGVPVVVNGPSEKARLVETYQVGETFPDGDAAGLTKALNLILADAETRERYKMMTEKAAAELNWQHEEGRLLAIYQRVSSREPLLVESSCAGR
jgi:glycosyltransferase involved in cell wall biosynthesis